MTLEEAKQKLTDFPLPWRKLFSPVFQSEEFQAAVDAISEEYLHKIVFPAIENVYKAFSFFPPKECKLVIIGQDPYFNKGQANGLAFSVDVEKLPPSLKNIFKELEREYGYKNTCGDLSYWAKQGVLLLNASLTVRKKEPNSHRRIWAPVTDMFIKIIDSSLSPLVYLLWGNDARKKKALITNCRNKIIETSHPSPLSFNKGFYGSDCFKRADEELEKMGKAKIDFRVKTLLR